MSKGKLTISRVGNSEQNRIEISVKEEKSGITFVTAILDLEKFALCLTGQAYIDCDIETRGLDKVGRKQEISEMEILLGDKIFRDKEAAAKLAVEQCPWTKTKPTEEGWYWMKQPKGKYPDEVGIVKLRLFDDSDGVMKKQLGEAMRGTVKNLEERISFGIACGMSTNTIAIMVMDMMLGTPCERIRHKQEIESLQAKIDSLMLEYCPEEMTEEQKENWAKHQQLVSE